MVICDAKVFEWVEIDLRPGTTRAQALELYRQTADGWAANPDLVGKTYLFDEASGIGGGLYLWRSREAAARWHGDEYRSMIKARYGAEPRIRLADALLNVAEGEVREIG